MNEAEYNAAKEKARESGEEEGDGGTTRMVFSNDDVARLGVNR